MVAIKHIAATQIVGGNTSSDTYVTIYTIAASATTTGNTYLIIATGDVGGGSTSQRFKFRLVRDALGTPTVLTGSEAIVEPETTTLRNNWSYSFLIETMPNETIDFQAARASGSGTAFTNNVVVVAINLSEDEANNDAGLARGVAWDYAENTTTNEHIGTFSLPTVQNTLTLNVVADDKWLVMATAQFAINSTFVSYYLDMFEFPDTPGAEQGLPGVTGTLMEGEHTNEQRVHRVSRIYDELSVGSHIWTLRTGDDGSDSSNNEHLFSSLFVINLAKFATVAVDFTATPITLAKHTANTEVANTGTFTPGSTGGGTADDFLLLSFWGGDVNGLSRDQRTWINDAIDAGGGDGVTPALTNSATAGSSYDPSDILPLTRLALGAGGGTDANYTAAEGARTLTLIGNASTNTGTQFARGRTLVAWSMELAGTGAVGQLILPNPVPMDLVAIAPTIAFGAITVSPAAVPMDLVAVVPAIAPGVITVSPSAVPMNLVAVAPTIALGVATVSPAAVPLDLVAVAPTIIQDGAPDQIVEPAAVPLNLVAVAPTIAFGVITVSPAAVPMDLVAVTPTITSLLTVSPSAVPLNLVAVAPTIIIGTITVSPAAVPMNLVAVAPTTIQDAVGGEYINSGTWAVSIDKADYPSTAVFHFGATLSCDNISSGARARLFNLTDGVLVAGSEVTITGKVLVGEEITPDNHVISTSFPILVTGPKVYVAQHRAEDTGDLIKWHGSYVKVVST